MSGRNKYVRAFAILVGGDGSILVEVLVGLVLLAVLMGPLIAAIHSGIDRGARVRARAGAMGLPAEGRGGGDQWSWGPQIASAEWRPGPLLHIQAAGQTSLGRTLGVWLDGWFLGEQCPDENGFVVVEASGFSGSAGREVTVRLRVADGPWGPPWRSLVPDLSGEIPLVATPWRGLLSRGTASGEEDTVAHPPNLANPLLAVSGTDGPVEVDSVGMPYVVPAAQSDRCALTLGEQTQSWRIEVGRALDLYF